LNLRVCEIPTTRIYPPTGKIPTKIAGSGYPALMAILLRTALGRYHPRNG
jgi:hypothetical protein